MSFFFWLNRKKQVVVTYHNIINDDFFDSAVHLGVSNRLSEFDKQIKLIISKFKVVTEIGKPKSCIITFDDGYRNNYTVAFHVLQKYKINAYFFIPVSMLKSSEILWVDKMLFWISYVPSGNYNIFKELSLRIDSKSRFESWKTIWQWLMENYSLKLQLLSRMDELYSFNNIKCDSKLFQMRFGNITSDEINEMKMYGNLIGAHSVNHDVLSKFTSFEKLRHDFDVCYSQVNNFYNTKVYSYPFGGNSELNKDVIRTCREAGFSSAFVNFEIETENNFSISRLTLGNANDKYSIYAKLSGLELFLKKIRKNLKICLR
jgi:peptidoglycan/xylan/chitin deacetylase (PgdA/CDA1 family)